MRFPLAKSKSRKSFAKTFLKNAKHWVRTELKKWNGFVLFIIYMPNLGLPKFLSTRQPVIVQQGPFIVKFIGTQNLLLDLYGYHINIK